MTIDWRSTVRGAWLGAIFALSVMILVGAIVFTPAMTTLTDLQPIFTFCAVVAVGAGAVAILASASPRFGPAVVTLLAGLIFVATWAYATTTARRDLGLINYSKHQHGSLSLEDIAADSPSTMERSNYRLVYALRRRIAGGELIVVEGAPFDDWQLTYRGDLASVVRAEGSALPAAPTAAEIAAWGDSAIVLQSLDGARLILPPQIAALRGRREGARFAIVPADAATFVLIPLQEGAGR